MPALAIHDTLCLDSDQDRPFGTVSDIDDFFFFSALAIVPVVVPLTRTDVILKKKEGMLPVTRHALGYP